MLADGRDLVGEGPADRWPAAEGANLDRNGPGEPKPRWGAFLPAIDQFDPAFFGISPREAEQLDPQQRLMLELSWEALETAGIVPDALRGSRAGVFFGVMGSDYARRLAGRPELLAPHSATGQDTSVIAGRVSYTFGLRGPSLVVNTACSSSLVAIHLACQSLRNGESTLALAGGVSVILEPDVTIAMAKLGTQSPDGRSKPFDARADGYVRSEGAGVVVLKTLRRALADRDPIMCLLVGSGVNNDGPSASLTAPSAEAQAELLRRVYEQAGIEPSTVGYVEAHGTGTALGDPTEASALGAVFAAGRPPDRPLFVGSLKGNLGHLEAAAGVAGLLKAALCLQRRVIPATRHFEQPNPKIAFAEWRLRVPTAPRPWPGWAEPAIAGVSAFGFGGTNCHVALRAYVSEPEAEGRSSEIPDQPLLQIVPLSAQNWPALRAAAQAWDSFLQSSPPNLDALAYTASVRRSHHPVRLAALVRTVPELRASLAAFAAGEAGLPVLSGEVSGAPRRVAFVCSGQGPTLLPLGRELFDGEPVFRQVVAEAERALVGAVDWSLTGQLRGEEASRLTEPAVAEPAIAAIQLGLAALWRSWGVVPGAVVGHSLGEVAAAAIVGALSVSDAMWLALQRGRAHQGASRRGRMALVETDLAQALALGEPAVGVSVAAINSPSSLVLSGEAAALDPILARFAEQGAAVHRLDVGYAAHGPAMDAVRGEFVDALRELRPRADLIPFYSTVTGRRLGGAELGADYWGRNLREPVQFLAAARALRAAGFTDFLELSPQPLLQLALGESLAGEGGDLQILPSLRRNVGQRDALRESLAALYVAGYSVEWPRLFPRPEHPVPLPTYPWQRQRYWLDLPPRNERRSLPDPDHAPGSAASLGRRLRSPALREDVFETVLGAGDPTFLQDHRLVDQVVVPAGFYLALASAAARVLAPISSARLVDVVFPEPLVLDSDRPVVLQTIVDPALAGARRFRIVSRPAEVDQAAADPEWILHAEGSLAVDPIAPDRRSTLVAGDEPVRTLNRLAFYRALGRLGYGYGPSLQLVDELQVGPAGARGLLKAPPSVAPEVSVAGEAAFLDACLQVAVGAFVGEGDGAGAPADLWLPGRFQSLWRAGPAVGAVRCVARRRLAPEPNAVVLDLEACDDTGQRVLRLTGLNLQRRRWVSPPGEDREPPLGWLRVPSWEMAQPRQGGTPRARRWLVVGDPGGVGDRLAARLTDRGQTAGVVLVDLAEGAGALEDRLRAERPAEVVFLGALDLPSAAVIENSNPDWQALLRPGVEAFLALVRALAVLAGPPPRLTVVTRGLDQTGRAAGLLAVSAAIYLGLVRTVAREHPELAPRRFDLDPSGEALPATLVDEVLGEQAEPAVVLRGNRRLVPSLGPFEAIDRASAAGREAPQALVISRTGDLSGLQLQPAARRRPGPGEVTLRVVGSGLNFRDVLTVLGLRPDDTGELGMECAGVVTARASDVTEFREGDPVVALLPPGGAFRTEVTCPASHLVAWPPELRWDEAVALPIAYLTAHDALGPGAALRDGERVLIHAAAGGVGLAALALARQTGAAAFATASPTKWPLLRQWGVAGVASSRDPGFARDLLPQLAGTGVDVVVNSLGAEFTASSLACLRRSGRWIELGKRSPAIAEEVRRTRPDARWLTFDLEQTFRDDPARVRRTLADLLAGVAAGRLPLLPLRRFALGDAASAFQLMAQGRHSGKIVLEASPSESLAVAQPGLIRPDATYLITGGLGALGLFTARWLIEAGARALVLIGRRAPAERLADIAALEQLGARVLIREVDVCDPAALTELFAQLAAEWPRLRGVFHLAGVLDDGVITQLTWPRVWEVLAPKVAGAWNLHRLTLGLPLDHFVLFSSTAAIFGAAGQANHAAANAFLDSLAHLRREQGLPAISINWGPWEVAGRAAELPERHQQRLAAGLGWIPPEQGVRLLGEILRRNPRQVAVVPNPVAAERTNGRTMPISVSSPPPAEGGISASKDAPTGTFLAARAVDPAVARRQLRDLVQTTVAQVLGLGAASPIPPDRPLRELGLDSLLSLELRNRLGRQVERSLPATLVFDHPTVTSLVDFLEPIARSEGPAAALDVAVERPLGNGQALLERLASLSDEEITRRLRGIVGGLADG